MKRKHGLDLPGSSEYASERQSRDYHLAFGVWCLARAETMPRGDCKGGGDAIGSVIGCKATLPQWWSAERLRSRSAGNVSERVRKFEAIEPPAMSKEIRKGTAFDLWYCSGIALLARMALR